MWPLKMRRSSTTTTSFPRSPSFSLSSLKDIQTLALDSPSDSAAADLSSPTLRRILHRVRAASSALRALRPDAPDRRILIYFTSLRVVRKTFDDCRAVRSILRSFRVALDERDLSMDSSYSLELKRLLYHQISNSSLPHVFIAGRYVGGADEIRRLHDSGELKRLIDGLAPSPTPVAAVCEGSGGVRFVLCGRCDGSHKRYSDKGGFRSCSDCNENGLVRCPDCSVPAV